MKKILFLLLISVTVLFFSCNKDNSCYRELDRISKKYNTLYIEAQKARVTAYQRGLAEIELYVLIELPDNKVLCASEIDSFKIKLELYRQELKANYK